MNQDETKKPDVEDLVDDLIDHVVTENLKDIIMDIFDEIDGEKMIQIEDALKTFVVKKLEDKVSKLGLTE